MAPPPSKLHPTGSNLLMRLVTEDTPPDMLAGSMDLRVTLPNGHTVKIGVDRSTPMMDLLIQITTAHKVSPGDYILQPIGDRGILPYKPSTPIGALETIGIKVVPRHSTPNNNQNNNSLNRKRIPLVNSLIGQNQPFEQTFRLQVHLPRNQLFVARLSPRTTLADILTHVCQEKNLDQNKYELRHPVNTEQCLQLSLCLADYKITEIVVVPRGSRPSTELSSSDIPALQRSNSEQRNGTSSAASSGSGSGGVLSILKRNGKPDGNRDGSLSGDSLGGRSSSPARSDESLSRSISPPVGSIKLMEKQSVPPPPIRHRKGRAPKPPSTPTVPAVEEEVAQKAAEAKQERTALVISHSRNSSDSSGYHEASVLSDTPENLNGHTTSPPGTINRQATTSAAPRKAAQPPSPGKLQYSLSMSDVSKTEAGAGRMFSAASNTSLSSNKKKQKAPAPPPLAAPDSVLMPPPPSTQPAASRSSSRTSSVLEPTGKSKPFPPDLKSVPFPVEVRPPLPRAPPPVETKTKSLDSAGSSWVSNLKVKVPVRLGPKPFVKREVSPFRRQGADKQGKSLDGGGVTSGQVRKFRPSAEFLKREQLLAVKYQKQVAALQSQGVVNVKQRREGGEGVSRAKSVEESGCLKPSLTRSNTDEESYALFLGQLAKILNGKAEYL
ncbi:Hypothetical predicted protein [Cloeon dipterum]|uniref:RBD domain-containing protein n=1 Tax=Cloeon dipterum TaxID=197152 RepID=A0A8S1C0P3_9INSE|nr:Hypothetical predicted protein [Cloeon dipterum]